MRALRVFVLRISLALCGLSCVNSSPGADFPLKEGDVWVMAGDSITAQHLHSNYFEAFCYARYPELKFAFRNSGVSGHTIPSTLARYEYDIDAWKPTIVSIELGMNDQGSFTPEQYIANMEKMLERIRAGKALPVMFTASPINNGNTLANLGGNQRLHQYAEALKTFSAKNSLHYADQFHLLIDVWGKNKPREVVANAIPGIQALAQDQKLAGGEHLRAFLKVQAELLDKPVSMQGDAVHPGPTGQLMMAAALLKELGAKSIVSTATLDATGKVVQTNGCRIDNVKAGDGTLSFDRLDGSLPFPIPEEAAGALLLFPIIEELSQYTLQVKGLKPATYEIRINGIALPSGVTAGKLEQGINLTALANLRPAKSANAIVVQGRAVLDAVAAKETIVNQWRGLSQSAHAPGAAPELKTRLAVLTKSVIAADENIRAAAVPQKLRFELVPLP